MTDHIAILCPSRSRPEQLKRMIRSAHDTSAGKVQIFVAVSPEEFEVYQAAVEMPNSDRVGVYIVTMPDCPTGFKWNKLAELAMMERPSHFMLGADDIVFTTPCWDAALIEHYESLDNKIHVYAFQDSRDENGTPHPIVTREYIEAMGYFLPPIFLHWYVDAWTVEIAKANNCFTHLKDYLLMHEKPSDKGQGDGTHNRIRQMGWRERDKWVNEKCGHFLKIEKNKLARHMITNHWAFVSAFPDLEQRN